MKKVILSISVLVLLNLIGCASRGNVAITNTKKLSQIKLHQSTKADVRNILGEPNGITTDSSGNEVWTYNHMSADESGLIKTAAVSEAALMLVPGIGTAIGTTVAANAAVNNTKIESSFLRLEFNDSGILVKKVYSKNKN